MGHVDIEITKCLANLLDDLPRDFYVLSGIALENNSFVYPASITGFAIEIRLGFAANISIEKEWLLIEKFNAKIINTFLKKEY